MQDLQIPLLRKKELLRLVLSGRLRKTPQQMVQELQRMKEPKKAIPFFDKAIETGFEVEAAVLDEIANYRD